MYSKQTWNQQESTWSCYFLWAMLYCFWVILGNAKLMSPYYRFLYICISFYQFLIFPSGNSKEVCLYDVLVANLQWLYSFVRGWLLCKSLMIAVNAWYNSDCNGCVFASKEIHGRSSILEAFKLIQKPDDEVSIVSYIQSCLWCFKRKLQVSCLLWCMEYIQQLNIWISYETENLGILLFWKEFAQICAIQFCVP